MVIGAVKQRKYLNTLILTKATLGGERSIGGDLKGRLSLGQGAEALMEKGEVCLESWIPRRCRREMRMY